MIPELMRILLLTMLLVPLFAQEAPPPPGGGQRRPPPEPKNLKVLKVAPAELIPLMRAYSAGLGVRCDHCHVQGNFAADDKPQKEMARKMIEMTAHINTMVGDGKVTCYTCHRGELEPKTAGPAAAGGPGNAPAARPPQ